MSATDAAQLKEQIRAATDPRDKERLQVVLWATRGQHSLAALAGLAGRARSTIQVWLDDFAAGDVVIRPMPHRKARPQGMNEQGMKPSDSQQGKHGVPADEQMDEAKRRPDERPDDECFYRWFHAKQPAEKIIPASQSINHLEKLFIILRFFNRQNDRQPDSLSASGCKSAGAKFELQVFFLMDCISLWQDAGVALAASFAVMTKGFNHINQT